MADIESNIRIDIDTSGALSALKVLQSKISAFHTAMQQSGNAANAAISDGMQRNLINSINATKQFSASLTTVKSSSESFTTALEKNKLSMGEYFRYAAGSTKTFGKLFTNEFNTIEKVARERVKTLQTQYIKMGRDANGAIQAIKVRPLMLDMEKLGTQVQMAAQKQQIFNQLVKQGSTNLLNFGKNTQWAGRQLMVGFTIPLTMMGTAAVKSFMEMEKAVLKFQRVYGDLATTAADTEAMVNSIKGLANEFTKYGIAVADTMALAADAAAMGKTGADLTAQVAEATRLAVLGGVEQAQALETTTSLTNAFGIAAEDLAGKIDFLNSVENQTVTSIEDLTIAIPKAAPVIKQLGGNVEDLAFFLTAMKEGGINASEGANALKSGLASMINPTGKAAEFLASFGINVKNIVDSNAGDVKGIILDMAYALDKLDPLNRAQAIEQLFGKFQFARMTTLFQNVIAEGSQASRVLDMTKASAQELAILSERELKKVEDSPMFKFQKALEDIKTSLIPLGEEFLKLITPLVEFGGNMLKQFNNLDAGVKQFVMGAIGVLGLIAPAAIMTFGLFANGIANIIKGVGTVNKLFYKLAGATTDAAGPMGYFTQEQLEAASVAASLEQAHANLTQQFTSETTAILQLRDAYNQAIQAMSQYNAAAAINRTSPNAPGGKPKKYNSGVVMVPGTGNSDTVPAMLTPGEAIIPADVAKKNRGFISAMIKGKIPGFNGGTSGLGLKVSQADAQLIQSEASRFGALGAQEQAVAEQALRALSQEKRQSIKTWRRLLGFIASTEIEDETISRALGKAIDFGSGPGASEKKKSAIKPFRGVPSGQSAEIEATKAGRSAEFKVSRDISEAAYMSLISQGYSPGDAAQVTGFNPGTNFTGVARGHNRDVGSAKAIAEGWQQPFINYDSRMENTILSSMTTHDKKGKTAVFEAYEKAANVLIGQNQEFRSEWENLRSAIDKDVSFNEAQRKTFAKVNAAVAGGGFGDQAITGRAKALGAGYNAVDIQNISGYQKKFTPEEIKTAEKNLVQRSSQILGISEKDLMQSGKDLVRGLVMGVEIEGEIKSPSRKMFQRGVDLVKGFIAGVKDKLDEAMQAGDQIGDAVVNGARPDGSIGGGRTQTGSRIKADLDAALAVDEGGNFILDRKGRPLTQKQYDRQLARQAAAQKRGRRAGKAAGILGTATMITGMVSGVGGPVGDIAGALTPFLGGLSAVAPLLMALPAPIALVVGGLGLIAFGLYKMNEQLTNARNEAMAMAKTFSSGREAMQGLAEFAGTVNPSETMDKIRAERRAEYQIVSGKNTFGAKYLESETGKNLVDEARKAKIDQGATAAAKNLGVQLAQAVSSNILTKEQAASIAANMGDALGDYDFAIDVNGTLVKLLGPGGEDLTKDPLKVKAEIIQTRQESTEGRGQAKSLIQNTQSGPMDWVVGILSFGQMQNQMRTNATEVAAAEAQVAQQVSDIISMGQQNLDQLELEHIKRLEVLEAAGDIKKINEENAKYEKDRASLLAVNADAIKKEYDFINKLEFKGNDQTKASARQIVDNLEASYKALFANADQQTKDIANRTVENIANNENLSFAEKATITATMNVENLDLFKQVQALFPVGDNIPLWKAIAQVTVELGPGSQEDVLALLPGFKDKKKAQQFTEYVVKVKTTAANPADGAAQAKAAIETMTTLSKIKDEVTGEPLNLDQYIDPKGNVTEKFKNISKKLKEVNDAFAKAKGKKISYEIFTKVTGLSLSQQAQKYFDSLPAAQQKVYTQTYLTIYDSIDINTPEGKARIKAWRKQQTAAGSTLGNWAAGLTDLQVAQNIAEAGAFQRTEESKGIVTPKTPTTPTTTGGGKKADPYENLLNRLKRVRDAAINAAGGLQELNRALANGSKISKGMFVGVEQQLMNQGYSTEFIDDMMALDEAARKAYMTINKAGQVVVTAAGKAYQKGLQEASLGDYQVSLQKTTNELGYQITAMSKLEEAGLSTAEAMEISSNANLAYAISTNASSEEIKNFIKWLGELKKKQTELDFSTEAGREKAVSSAVSKAMEYFAAIEKQIDEDFEQGTNKSGKNAKNLNIGNLKKDIQDAQVQIEDYQYQIDDLQYLLDGIQEKEDEINEKYDKRAEALDKIWNINKDIAAQQKGQLDIAQALSSGDINAAARAVQEERARRVQESQQIQKDALENARKKELAAVTSTDGKTRTQIEKEIRDLNKEIAKIEEEKLEPLTRNLGIAERTRDAVKDLVGKEGYLGLTKTEWGNVETAARLATVQAESFAKVIRDTLKMIPGFTELFDEAGNFTGFKFDPAKYATWLKGGSSEDDGGTDDGGTDDGGTDDGGVDNGNKDSDVKDNDKKDTGGSGSGSGGSGAGAGVQTGAQNGPFLSDTVRKLVSSTTDKKSSVVASTTLGKMAGVIDTKTGKLVTTADTADRKIKSFVDKALGTNRVGVPVGTTLRALMGKSEGGLIPKYLADGGLAFNAIGTDTVPAMLTPGEFVVRRHAVKNFGVDRLKAINNGASINDSVYNYEVNVNVKSDANPDQIARAVVGQIRQADSQRIRSNIL